MTMIIMRKISVSHMIPMDRLSCKDCPLYSCSFVTIILFINFHNDILFAIKERPKSFDHFYNCIRNIKQFQLSIPGCDIFQQRISTSSMGKKISYKKKAIDWFKKPYMFEYDGKKRRSRVTHTHTHPHTATNRDTQTSVYLYVFGPREWKRKWRLRWGTHNGRMWRELSRKKIILVYGGEIKRSLWNMTDFVHIGHFV